MSGVLWSCVLCLQRPPPRYSQQYMPDTSFTCQNKILGSYYADPETDCQLFHVCVSVAGTVQDYRFLCPNGTAFDQESQTCADWYDVDCEAATLYYASDNFDLYRLGSGLESLHFDSIRSDAEPQDHLQRSETSDAVRSSANALSRVASTNFKDRGSKDILHGSSSSNYFNNRNNAKDDDYDDKVIPESRKKSGIRKVSRKQQLSANDNTPTTTTSATAHSSKSYNFYTGNNYNHQRAFDSSTTPRIASTQDFKNTQKAVQQTTYRPTYTYSTYTTTTYRPSTNYPEGFTGFPIITSTTAKTTTASSNNNKNNFSSGFGTGNSFSSSSGTTSKPSTYKKVYYDPSTLPETFSPSTASQPSTNYQSSDFNNNFQRNYNNIQRTSSTSNFASSTSSPNFFDSFNNQFNSRSNSPSIRQEYTETTDKISNNFSNNGNAPTTYSPITKKNDHLRERFNTQSKNEGQYNDGQYKKSDDNKYSQNNGQYYDKSSQSKSTNYYDSTKPPKKVTQYNSYDSGNSGKYYETTTTANYNFGRSGAIGFSPSSINHLAESPKTTTPVPRKTGAPTTYNPNSFNTNNQRAAQSQTNSRGTTYVSHSARPFSTTQSFTESTTLKPTKTGKKNDYDYAYYDNAGALEYDGIELEHVTGNKESSKITRS